LYKGIINCQIPGDFVVVAKNNKKKIKKGMNAKIKHQDLLYVWEESELNKLCYVQY